MAPVIRSRYEQYKRDTQQFTTWIAQTAILLGYPISKFDLDIGDVEIIVRSAASKKNARKRARAKEQAQLVRQKLGQNDEISRSGAPLSKWTLQLTFPRSKTNPQMPLKIKKVED